jgi:hypothetical protein
MRLFFAVLLTARNTRVQKKRIAFFDYCRGGFMLPSERHSLALRVVAHLAKVLPEYGPNVRGPVAVSRIAAAIGAVDALVLTSTVPILLAELLPAVDLIVVRDWNRPPSGEPSDTPLLAGDWEEGSVDEQVAKALGNIATAFLTQQATGTKGVGALSHSGSDGIHYFLFKSEYRQIALRQVGLNESEVEVVSSGVAAGA